MVFTRPETVIGSLSDFHQAEILPVLLHRQCSTTCDTDDFTWTRGPLWLVHRLRDDFGAVESDIISEILDFQLCPRAPTKNTIINSGTAHASKKTNPTDIGAARAPLTTNNVNIGATQAPLQHGNINSRSCGSRRVLQGGVAQRTQDHHAHHDGGRARARHPRVLDQDQEHGISIKQLHQEQHRRPGRQRQHVIEARHHVLERHHGCQQRWRGQCHEHRSA